MTKLSPETLAAVDLRFGLIEDLLTEIIDLLEPYQDQQRQVPAEDQKHQEPPEAGYVAWPSGEYYKSLS
jgi:hypothetical protein